MPGLGDILVAYGPIALVVGGILVAGLANGMETGVYRLNRIRLRLRAREGDRRARTLLELLGDVRGLIVVCLIGYNGGVYLATVFTTLLVREYGLSGGRLDADVVATMILTPVFFVFTDVTPKSIFTVEADRWMYRVSGILRGAYAALRAVGLVGALKGVSTLVLKIAARRGGGANPFAPRQRLRAFLREGAAEGVITGYQDELVEKVLGLEGRYVRHVMIPMSRVTATPLDVGREGFLERLRRHSYTRLPVWEGRRDHVVGIVHVTDVLSQENGTFDLGAVVNTEFVTLGPEMRVSQAMFRMQRRRAAMAVVVGPRGRAVGIVTMKDLVEEIVGELPDW